MSDRKLVNGFNWFDALHKDGAGRKVATVATVDLPDLFADGVTVANDAFDEFLDKTQERSPDAPPPVALIGHSKGGLMIRKVLRDRAARAAGRVRLVVTLHSPHAGSSMATAPQTFATTFLDYNYLADLNPLFRDPTDWGELNPLKDALRELIRQELWLLTALVMDWSERELSPGSDLIRSLADGEMPVPGVTYLTFGGTSPLFVKLYQWEYSNSGQTPTPQVNITFDGGQPPAVQVDTTQRPVELQGLSPLFDALRYNAVEAIPGQGDGLVTNTSARLAWSTHFTHPLNHAEVLWSPLVQMEVMPRLLALRAPAPLSVQPATAFVLGGGTQRFFANAGTPIVWSVTGPGAISREGVYTAPEDARNHTAATVVATADDGTERTALARVNLSEKPVTQKSTPKARQAGPSPAQRYSPPHP